MSPYRIKRDYYQQLFGQGNNEFSFPLLMGLIISKLTPLGKYGETGRQGINNGSFPTV